MATQSKWYSAFLTPQIVAGMLSLVFAAGVFSNRIKGIEKDINANEGACKQRYDELQGRYQRQFELIRELSRDIKELKEESAYRRGLEDSKK